ncbi:hypothetical protein JXA80_13525 [bacterium]|nr:hypothetical protein [candidate division CSSED10-310 bacterium]
MKSQMKRLVPLACRRVCWLVCWLACWQISAPVSRAALDVRIHLNQAYHGDGDILAMDLRLSNPGPAAVTADFYLCLEIAGAYYFYPSFTAVELDHKTMTIVGGQTYEETIIPPVPLPAGLPDLTCTVYAVAFEPGTYMIASNVDIAMIRMRSHWQELPIPEYANTFYFMPGVDGLDFSGDQAVYDQVAADLYSHFPQSGLYLRRGVTILDPVDDSTGLSRAVEAAAKADLTGMAIGYHIGVTCHHGYGEMETLRRSDRRLNQWESDGTIFDSGQDDVSSITVSRYAAPLMTLRENRVAGHARGFMEALAAYPDTVVCLNGPIEAELRRADIATPHYADYSPLMVKEFRDWLRHTGIYDEVSGAFMGEGVPREQIGGHDFSGDPSPGQAAFNGPCFNSVFGTQFTSWDLLYWDPDRFPDPLAMDADPLPGAGEPGYTVGGFDPPRDAGGTLTGGNTLFQTIWDGWRSDHHNGHQTGFGFRQAAVHRYVQDNARWLMANGVPRERIFTHQIPVDFIGNWVRERGSASPFWTAINDYSNAGYTAYFETTLQDSLFLVTQMLSPRWGMFEYHPDPYMEQPVSYYLSALEKLYQYRCQILVPLELYQADSGTYALIDSNFETAVNHMLTAVWPGTLHRRFDAPYFNTEWVDYVPPAVSGVQRTGDRVTWSPVMWSSHPDLTWSDWGEFSHFDVHVGSSADFVPDSGTYVGSATGMSFEPVGPGYIKVLAVSRPGYTSRW